MAQNQQFLQDFQSSMDRLNGMNDMIQNSIQQKKNFSSKLLDKLKAINDKIRDLVGQINKLKENVDTLQGQVSSNSTNISDKDKQLTDLTQKLTALEAEKQQISQQFTDFQKQVIDEKSALQQKIDDCESKIRQLTDENTNIKNQADALTSELSGKGDLASQHANEIKSQTEDFQKQLETQQQANQTKIDELMAKINESDVKMLDLQTQLQQKTDEAAAHVQSINDSQSQGQTQIAQLNQQIADLKKENDDLIQRIIAATQAIQQASDNLELLANTVPNQQTDQDVDQLFSEIEQSIQNISGVLQGNPMQPPIAQQKINQNEPITLTDAANNQPVQVPYKTIFDGIRKKVSQNAGPKYKDALTALKNATPDQVASILNEKGVSFKNNQIMGGRKTKKMKKRKKE